MYYVFIPFYLWKMFTNIIGGYKFYMQVKYLIGSTNIIYNLKSTWRKSAHLDSTQMNIFRQWQQSSILYLKIISQQDNDQVYSKIEVFDPC